MGIADSTNADADVDGGALVVGAFNDPNHVDKSIVFISVSVAIGHHDCASHGIQVVGRDDDGRFCGFDCVPSGHAVQTDCPAFTAN